MATKDQNLQTLQARQDDQLDLNLGAKLIRSTNNPSPLKSEAVAIDVSEGDRAALEQSHRHICNPRLGK